MAGTIPLSLTQQFDELGAPLAGGKLYLIQSGTTATPQSGYQNSALTLPWPNPIILDAAGRVPQFFLADGSIKIRLTDSAGVEKLVADGVLVVGASSGGGGSAVDSSTVLATGDLKARYGTGVHSGFVRANGRAIGSATSGAAERASSDCQALFEYLWSADANLSVLSGRGATANADWLANKTIALPDWRGRALACLDDAGNTAAGRLSATYFGATATTLGAAGGSESQALITAQLPSHTHTGTTGSEDLNHTHPIAITSGVSNQSLNHAHNVQALATAGGSAGTGATGNPLGNNTTIVSGAADLTAHTHNVNGDTGTMSTNAIHNHQFTTNATGSGSAHNNTQPTMLATIYIKL